MARPSPVMTAPVTVSVVVTCFNQARLVGEAIESVLAQSRAAAVTQILVVDDGSSDDSLPVATAMASLDDRIEVISKANGGPASARNEGIARATGTHIAFLDGDDTWLPDRLGVELDALTRHPDAAVVYSDYFESAPGSSLSVRRVAALSPDVPHVFERMFVNGATILPSAALVARRAFDECGLFDDQLPANEDPDMWLRIAGAGLSFLHVAEPLIVKRVVPGSVGSDALVNFGAHRRITEKLVASHPGLRHLVGRRLSRIVMREALGMGSALRRREFLTRMVSAVRLDPRNGVAWAYLLVAMAAPGPPAQNIAHLKRVLTDRFVRR